MAKLHIVKNRDHSADAGTIRELMHGIPLHFSSVSLAEVYRERTITEASAQSVNWALNQIERIYNPYYSVEE